MYQSMSGDADVGTSVFTMTGGSLSSVIGPSFYVTNTDAVVYLQENANVTSQSGKLLTAGADNWGTSGSNGGIVDFTINHVSVAGTIYADSISSITFTAINNSVISSDVHNAEIALESTSKWIVTGDSELTLLSDSCCIDSTLFLISNIYGNGYTVTYDKTLSGNSLLNAQSYSLANGGYLIPATSSTTSTTDSQNSQSSVTSHNGPPASGFPSGMPPFASSNEATSTSSTSKIVDTAHNQDSLSGLAIGLIVALCAVLVISSVAITALAAFLISQKNRVRIIDIQQETPPLATPLNQIEK